MVPYFDLTAKEAAVNPKEFFGQADCKEQKPHLEERIAECQRRLELGLPLTDNLAETPKE